MSDSPSELSPSFETVYPYGSSEKIGVIFIATAGLISLLSVLFVFTIMLRRIFFRRTHILGYFVCLLVSNFIQSSGTVLNLKWISESGVHAGTYCTIQAGVKQAGNLGNAFWTLTIAIHLFDLLFLRYSTTNAVFFSGIAFGWAVILMIVLIGPAVIESPEKGPYFGISGQWCWITDEYPAAQTYLEYFFGYFSAGVCFLLYTTILLRIRGNLTFVDGKPKLRWVPRGQGWQLSLGRDSIDSSMIRVVQHMIWYPVAYSILLVPIGIARLSKFAGSNVPQWAIFTTAVIFNLTGFVNVVLLIVTHRIFPETESLPDFSTQRQKLGQSVIARHGVTPFMLSRADSAPEVPRLPGSRCGLTIDTTNLERRRQSQESVVDHAAMASQIPMQPVCK